MILIKNKITKIKINSNKIKNDVATMLKIAGYPGFDIGILFTTNQTIKKYNKTYREKDKATDILSFPYHTELKAGEKITILDPEDKNLGDIIISLEFAKKDAKRLTQALSKHLETLLAHGIAHLLGHDHKSDTEYKAMQKFEHKLLKTVNQI